MNDGASSDQPSGYFIVWSKILVAWLAGFWGGFTLQGALQILVLLLTGIFTAGQIYIQWRDKIRRQQSDDTNRI